MRIGARQIRSIRISYPVDILFSASSIHAPKAPIISSKWVEKLPKTEARNGMIAESLGQIDIWSFGRDLSLLIIGGALGLLTNWAISIIKRRRRQDDLRSAFITEIKWSNNLEDWVEEYRPVGGQRLEVSYSSVPRDVYRNNTHRLGLLSESERESVIEYYMQAEIVTRNAEIFQELRMEEKAKQEMIDNIHESVEVLLDRRDNAISELEQESGKSLHQFLE